MGGHYNQALAMGVLVLVGCGAGPRAAVRAVDTVPYRLEMTVTSGFRDPYRVLAGPGESYGSYPFVARTRLSLEQYARSRSAPGASAVLGVRVHLLQLNTTYRQVGASIPRQGVRVAVLGGVTGLGWGGWDGGDLSIPDEIHKGAVLGATIVMALGGREVDRVDVEMEYQDLVLQEDYDAWAYNYRTTLAGVRAALIERVGVQIDRVVGREP